MGEQGFFNKVNGWKLDKVTFKVMISRLNDVALELKNPIALIFKTFLRLIRLSKFYYNGWF